MQDKKGNIGVIVSFIIIVCLIGLIVYALLHTNPSDVSDNSKLTESAINNNNILKEQNTTPTKNMEQNTNARLLKDFTPVAHVTKLEKIDLIVGSGEEVKADATVSVHYTGAVAATGKIFQSSKDFGTNPITFPLAGVIKGWTIGIPGMKIGGTRRLIIPAEMAYGANPPGGSGIPANADLVFDVELVAIK